MPIKFNPLGDPFDIVRKKSTTTSGDQNFSYKLIDTGETIVVPSGQQMLVDEHISVLGHLTVLGEVIDISNRAQEHFFYDLIDDSTVVDVIENRLLMFKGHLTVDGVLRVKGRLAEV